MNYYHYRYKCTYQLCDIRIKLFKFVIKMSWWVEDRKKCWEKQCRRTTVEVWFIALNRFLFFCTARDQKNDKTHDNNRLPLKNRVCVWSRFIRPRLPRLPLPPSLVFHIAQETGKHRDYVIVVRTKSWQLQDVIQHFFFFFFFVILWHDERRGGGGRVKVVAVDRPLDTHTQDPCSVVVVVVVFVCVCVCEDVSSSEHLHSQVRSEERRQTDARGGGEDRRQQQQQLLICSRPWESPGCPGCRSPAACSPCRSCRSPAPGAPAGAWSGRFAPSEGKPAPLQSAGTFTGVSLRAGKTDYYSNIQRTIWRVRKTFLLTLLPSCPRRTCTNK